MHGRIAQVEQALPVGGNQDRQVSRGMAGGRKGRDAGANLDLAGGRLKM